MIKHTFPLYLSPPVPQYTDCTQAMSVCVCVGGGVILCSTVRVRSWANLLKRLSELLPLIHKFCSRQNSEESPCSFPQSPKMERSHWCNKKCQRKICFDVLSRHFGIKGTCEQTDSSWGTHRSLFPDLPWAPPNLHRVSRATIGWI